MEGTIEFSLVLYVILSVIILIMFIVLCVNVAQIKKSIVLNRDNFDLIFIFYIQMGMKDKAKELLLKDLTSENLFYEAFYGNEEEKKRIIDKYKKYFDELNIEPDYDKIKEFIKK